MTIVGHVESLWRYPVKSMRGEQLTEAFAGFAGIFGDRIHAFHDTAAIKGFPWLTARDREDMVLYEPRFRHPDRARVPPNLAEAEVLGPGLTPIYPAPEDLAVDVRTPSGEVLAIDDPALIAALRRPGTAEDALRPMRSERALTDCRPVSFLSTATVRQIGDESGIAPDPRRFRMNILADLTGAAGFAEDAFAGRTLRIGAKVEIAIVGTDPRCKMITIDPDTAAASPEVLRAVARNHGGMAGVYGAVLTEGIVRAGDEIVLLDR